MALASAAGLAGLNVHLATGPFPLAPAHFYRSAAVIFVVTLVPEFRWGYRRLKAGRWGKPPIQFEPKLFHNEAFLVLHNHGPSDQFRAKLLEVRKISVEPRLPTTLQWKDRVGDERTVAGTPEAFGICKYSFERVREHRGDEVDQKCYFRYEPYAISPYFESIKVEMPWTGATWHVEVAFKIRVASEKHEIEDEAWVRLEVEVYDRDESPFSDWAHLDVQSRHDSEPASDSVSWPHSRSDDEKSEHKVRYTEDLWELYGEE